MSSLRWGHRRTATFADAFCRTPRGRGYDHEVVSLVHVAEALSRADIEQPRPEFVRNLRSQLMSEAATVFAPRGPVGTAARVSPARPVRRAARRADRQVDRLRRRLGSLVATIAVAGGSLGVAMQSAEAVPGELLYPMKRGLENAQLVLANGASEVGSTRLALAQERLDEVEALAAGGVDAREARLIRRALDDFSALAEGGADSLFDDFADHGRRDTVGMLTAFMRRSNVTMAGFAGTMPPSADDSFATATDTLTDLRSRAGKACGGCLLPSVTDPMKPLSALVPDLPTPDEALKRLPAKDPVKPATDAPGVDSDKALTPEAPAAVPSLPTVPPDVSTPDPTEGTGAPSTGKMPAPPKVTEPVRKLVDPIVKKLPRADRH
ncbi:MAG: hypothetical protein GEU96_17315 [Propionibacteriales bacterium]|nr:hypothetical protein [Propionibacteriales bacterium]